MSYIRIKPKDRKALEQVFTVWNPQQLSIATYEELRSYTKFPPHAIELMMLHSENFAALAPLKDILIFRGGTAVQSWIENPLFQRISADLDFNCTIGHPEVIHQEIDKLNSSLRDSKKVVEIQDVPYGLLIFDKHNTITGTLNFYRILPTRNNEYIKYHNKLIQGRRMRIQVNYKHSKLPAKEINYDYVPKLFPQTYLPVTNKPTINIASPGDLIADKLLTVTKIEGFAGRERLKDVYDLILLSTLYSQQTTTAKEKLQVICTKTDSDYNELITASCNRLSEMAKRETQALGFLGQVGIDGRNYCRNWTKTVNQLVEFVQSHF